MPRSKTVICQLKKLDDPWIYKGLAGNSGEKKGRGAPEKIGDVVLDVFNEHLTPEIKTINMDLVVITQGMTLHLQILDVLVNKSLNVT